jgi:hypothetical protein
MKPKHLKLLLPCDSLEELSLERAESDARVLLGAWSVAWHPALIAAMDDVPTWLPAGDPSASPSMEHDYSSAATPSETVFLMPESAQSLGSGRVERGRRAGRLLISSPRAGRSAGKPRCG